MTKHLALSRALILLMTVMLACVPTASATNPISKPISHEQATSSSLSINADGVIYQGAFLQTPVDQGGLAILHNLDALIPTIGFQSGWDGWTWYTSLENQSSWVQDSKLFFKGQLPASDTWYEQEIYPQGGLVHYEISLDETRDNEAVQYANLVFYLPIPTFVNQPYLSSAGAGTYPETQPKQPLLLDGVTQFQIMSDDPTRNLTFSAPDGMSLFDARLWGSQEYMLAIDLPLDSGQTHFTITPASLDPGPNRPALRYSHIGYACWQPKQAVMEIDQRASFSDLNARLERKTGAASRQTVLQSVFTPALDDHWRQFAIFDFSQINTPGEYRIVWSQGETDWFAISAQPFRDQWQNTLDYFLPFQMSHLAVDLGDGLSHAASTLDDAVQTQPGTIGADSFIAYESSGTPVEPGETIPVNIGGWYDAGDYDLNVSAQAFVVHQLALTWQEFTPQRDRHTLDVDNRQLIANQANGVPDLIEQIEWGVRWLLSMQQSDGRVYVGVVETADRYGSTSLPEDMTDGIPDTGDERLLFVDYHSDVNLKFSAALAAASRALQAYDPALASQAWQAANLAWDYFNNHDEVYRQTVYFYGWEEGREQMISAAASELYLTAPHPTYLQAIATFEAYFNDFPTDWPSPTVSHHSGFWYAPPFLARLYPSLSDGDLKAAIQTALQRAAEGLVARLSTTPFAYQEEWQYNDWGMSGVYINSINDAYWLSKDIPQNIGLSDALPAAYWLFGLHPVNDHTLVFGSTFPQPDYHYHSILHVRFGHQPANVPGAVVPGIATYIPSNVIYYSDLPDQYRNNEACIYDSAAYLFAASALDHYPGFISHLPLVSLP